MLNILPIVVGILNTLRSNTHKQQLRHKYAFDNLPFTLLISSRMNRRVATQQAEPAQLRLTETIIFKVDYSTNILRPAEERNCVRKQR